MISKDQYEHAKRIVQEFEHSEMMEAYLEDDEDDRDWKEEQREREEEENAERAATCNCGAWVFGKDGRAYHVADCYCGAD